MTPLASKYIKRFTPAVLGPSRQVTPASAECRTQTPVQYLGGTPDFRTDVYAGPTSGHLVTFADRIAHFKELGVKMTPELKAQSVAMPFDGFAQEGVRADDQAITREGDLYKVLDVLAKDVGILGVFSDWAGPVTFCANCIGLK